MAPVFPSARAGSPCHVSPEEGGELTGIEIRINRLLIRDEIPGFQGAKVKGTLSQLLGTAVGAPNIPIWDYAVTKSYASSHAALIKAYLSAIANATNWAILHPTQAATLFDKTYPASGYTDAYNISGWQLTIPFLRNTQGKFFTETNAQWSTLAKALKSVKLIKSVPAPSVYYTNKFLPAS